MDVVANSFLPGDPRLVDSIVYELKSQGIFDQFRKECFSDVDTKPAYQNLRQRVEGSVSGFLKEQSWKPDMNKNQVREMLRKRITESGYLETGVERIVDQVVNPKINSVFLPKVEEVIYKFLGVKQPNPNVKSEHKDSTSDNPATTSTADLLADLESVSPEPQDHIKVEVKEEEVTNKDQHEEEIGDDDDKTEEDESPPFEPLDEQPVFVAHEENSIDSHISGYSGLASHESTQSNEINKIVPMEQDSQTSRNSSDSRLSIVTSDENSKLETEKVETKDKEKQKQDIRNKDRERHRSRDGRNSKESKSAGRHSSSSSYSRTKDEKSRDRKDSASNRDRGDRSRRDRDKDRRHSSSSSRRDRDGRDKSRPSNSSSHSKDSKLKDSKHRDREKDKSSSSSHKHSSSSHKKDKEKKKSSSSKDDHYSSRDKRGDRRSTDRDSNDGSNSHPRTNEAPKQPNGEPTSTNKNSDFNSSEQSTANSDNTQKRMKLLKPKCASNIQEAMRLMKIRKQLAKLEKSNQLCLVDVDAKSTIIESSSINIDLELNKLNQEKVNSKIAGELEVVPSPLQNTVISQDNWDAMEAKLRQEVIEEFQEGKEVENVDQSVEQTEEEIEDLKFFETVDENELEFLQFVNKYLDRFGGNVTRNQTNNLKGTRKRKLDDSDVKNNNRSNSTIAEKKKNKNNKLEKLDKPDTNEENFALPLSPAESESCDKKEEIITAPKRKSNFINAQRYSSDDLYKPRPTFAQSRRRNRNNPDS